MSKITVQRIVDVAAIEALRDEWDDFVCHLGADAFFARHAFALADLGIGLQEGDRPAHRVLRRDAKLVAIAPLIRRSGPPGVCTLDWAQSRTSLYATLPVAPCNEDEAMRALAADILAEPGLRKLKADFVPEDSSLARFLEGMGAVRDGSIPRHEVRLYGNLLERFSRRRRGLIRKAGRQLAARGSLEFGLENQPAALSEIVDWIIDRKISQYDPAGDGTAWIAWPETRTYFRETAAALAVTGNAVAGDLRLDGRRIGASLFYLCGDTGWFSKTAYDSELAEFSPGWVVAHESFEALAERGIELVDMMLGEGLLKSSLATASSSVHRYRLKVNSVAAHWRALRSRCS